MASRGAIAVVAVAAVAVVSIALLSSQSSSSSKDDRTNQAAVSTATSSKEEEKKEEVQHRGIHTETLVVEKESEAKEKQQKDKPRSIPAPVEKRHDVAKVAAPEPKETKVKVDEALSESWVDVRKTKEVAGERKPKLEPKKADQVEEPMLDTANDLKEPVARMDADKRVEATVAVEETTHKTHKVLEESPSDTNAEEVGVQENRDPKESVDAEVSKPETSNALEVPPADKDELMEPRAVEEPEPSTKVTSTPGEAERVPTEALPVEVPPEPELVVSEPTAAASLAGEKATREKVAVDASKDTGDRSDTGVARTQNGAALGDGVATTASDQKHSGREKNGNDAAGTPAVASATAPGSMGESWVDVKAAKAEAEVGLEAQKDLKETKDAAVAVETDKEQELEPDAATNPIVTAVKEEIVEDEVSPAVPEDENELDVSRDEDAEQAGDAAPATPSKKRRKRKKKGKGAAATTAAAIATTAATPVKTGQSEQKEETPSSVATAMAKAKAKKKSKHHTPTRNNAASLAAKELRASQTQSGKKKNKKK